MIHQNSQKFSKEFYCKNCDYLAKRKSDFNKHLQSIKHNDTNKHLKKHICECGREYKHNQNLYRHKKTCNYKKNKEHNFENEKWIKMDKKWIKMDKSEKMSIFEKTENPGCKNLHICECGKSYKYQSGLSKHKKSCEKYKESTSIVIQEENKDLKEMVKELMIKCTELAEKPTTNITNNTQFNVMNYLNTECKDAMNLSDFINNIDFSIKDLELLNSKGYQVAMENTFVKQLCDMEKTKRPIHCSDKKRKSFYIKDNDVWGKDTDNEKLIKGMKRLSFIHGDTLNKWKNKNKDWNNNERKQVFYCNSIIEFAKCDKEKERNKVLSKLVNLSVK